MPSPFPGMDPYIEDPEIGADFQMNLASEIQGQLNLMLRRRYVTRLMPYFTYELVDIPRRHESRLEVGMRQSQPSASATAGAVVAVLSTAAESNGRIEFPLRLISIEVRAVGAMELVTAIEILSPVNKQPSHTAFKDYQRKRRELFRSSAHLLEIDLLRGGTRPPLDQPVPPAPYYITLSRVENRPKVEVWPLQLWHPLPVVPVPLRDVDPDVPLDMGAAVASVYKRAGYTTLIDYHGSPPPPKFEEADLLWIDKQLRERGAR